MSELESPQGTPNLSEWHQAGLIGKELLGKGTEGEVNRLTFGTEGNTNSYAFKEIPTLEEAQRIYSIYEELRNAGLPVLDFLKIRTTKIDGKPSYGIAMADATEGGTLRLQQLHELQKDNTGSESLKLVRATDDPESLSMQIISALAIMHNHDISNFHVGLSIFLRVDAETGKIKDFIFLDYGNFSKGPSPDDTLADEEGNYDFERKAERDRKAALSGLVDSYANRDEMHQLNALYHSLRESNQQQFDQFLAGIAE